MEVPKRTLTRTPGAGSRSLITSQCPPRHPNGGGEKRSNRPAFDKEAMGRNSSGIAKPAAGDCKAIACMAAQGLTLAEILAELGLPRTLSGPQREAAELAYRKGRASGIAQVKRAQFKAALEGKTSAQAQVLKRLGVEEEKHPHAETEFKVVRKIRAVADENTGG